MRLKPVSTARVPTLKAKAGTTERTSGRKWMETRERIARQHDYQCAVCKGAWVPNRDQIDHEVPLEQGGSNDDVNLRPLCDECHKAKTAGEAGRRFGK